MDANTGGWPVNGYQLWRSWNAEGLRSQRMRGVLLGVLLLSGSRLMAQQPSVATHVDANTSSRAEELFGRRVTITLKQVSLKRAIDSISRAVNIFIQYQAPMLTAHTAPVTVAVREKPLGVLLEQVLDGTHLRVVADGKDRLAIVTIPEHPTDSVPDVGVISGHVVDSATGRAIRGATVKVAGTKFTVAANDSGRFTMRNVPAGDMLLNVRAFGYRPADRGVTVTTGAPLTVRITLVAAPNILSGVVTTATGVQRKIEVGNDITTINVDSVRQVAPISSVTDLLETRVPGLTVVHSSGVPGDPARLRLRGAGSIQLNNDPIVIVDGIRVYGSQSDRRNANLAPTNDTRIGGQYNAPSPLDQIDPNSIETIEVLKGPSASAIYGSDAASGVIVITTRQGQAGPANWSLSLVGGTSWIPGKWSTNYYRFGDNSIGTRPLCPWYVVGCQVDSVVPFQALNDPRYTLFARGNTQQASAFVRGGVPTLTYSVTGSTQSTLGNLKLPGSEVQRYDSLYGPIPHSLVRPDRMNMWNVTGSLKAVPRPTISTTLTSSLTNSTQRRSSLETAITQISGEYLSPAILIGPLLDNEYERATDDQVLSNNTLAVQWQPSPWLPLQAVVGVSTLQRNDVTYVPFGVLFEGDTMGSYGLGRGSSRTTTATLGTQMPMFRQRITTSVGGNFYSSATADFQVYTNQLAPGITAPTSFLIACVGAGQTICNSPSNQSTTNQSTYGWYVEPRFNVASRFFASPGFRLDGGSGGTKSSGLGGLSGFPKMDFSYVAVDRQDESPFAGVISFFRPRLGFGYAGTQPAPADKLRLYNIGSTYTIHPPGSQGYITSSGNGCNPSITLDGTTLTPAVCINALGNTVLRPERSSELEGGFDATLWGNHLSITYSQYNKTRHDAIIGVPVAPSVFSSGLQQLSIQKNVGVIRNTGTEVSVSATPLQSRALGWTIGGNFSKNNNVVVRLNRDQLPIVMYTSVGSSRTNGIQTRVQAGYPLFAEFVRPIVGYTDVNKDGMIGSGEVRYGDSLVYVGHPDPNYQINLTNDVSLFSGRLSVHTTFAYANGMTQYNQGACSSNAFRLLPNTPNTPLATEAAVVAAGCVDNQDAAVSPIGLIQTVNTFRFQSISVNYEVPARMVRWMRAPRMTVALQGSNLGLHTNYRGKDPDVNAFSTANAGDQTTDTGQIPAPREWLLRVSVGN